jgi:histidyl-tRNA synthetase
MQSLTGFREFYPDACARKNYILETWRTVSRRYGFSEYDGPVVEPLALYEKKSGGELVGQMFTVSAMVEPGEIKGALRPEMTPTLARMVTARERDFKKPMKWFSVPVCFRHERNQRGRQREFYQLNVDIIGESAAAADAELVAVLVDTLRAFALTESDFVVRLSSRAAWQSFFRENAKRTDGAALTDEDEYSFFQIIDKAERAPAEKTTASLLPFGMDAERVMEFMRSKIPSADLAPVIADLTARGLAGFVEVDYAIVRGLAYYTGVVFEVFDRAKNERALAGGGRYDGLLSLMSDGKVKLPALGFGMGDVVLEKVIEAVPAAKSQMLAWCEAQRVCEVFVVVANEDKRPQALAVVQQLRDAGRRVDFSLTEAKIGKQFQSAEFLGAKYAVVVGDDWPMVKVKTVATREESLVEVSKVSATLA